MTENTLENGTVSYETSEQVETAVATAPPKPRKPVAKPAAKPAAKGNKPAAKGNKPAPKPAPKPAAKGNKPAAKPDASGGRPAGKFGVERDKDLPWCPKKIALFKALKAMRATSPDTAKPVKDVAARAELTARDVRHYAYHARAGGLADVADMEGSRGHCVYLTAKGTAVDLAAEAKAFEKARKEKVK